jgi:hypothetical protein
MKAFKLDPTHLTPKIVLDHKSHHFELSGVARPEDARAFFDPILKWLDDYRDSLSRGNHSFTPDNPMVVKCQMEYFNSSSAKFLYDVLEKFHHMSLDGQTVRIDWIYHEEDDDVLEAGQELADLLVMQFNYVPVTD